MRSDNLASEKGRDYLKGKLEGTLSRPHSGKNPRENMRQYEKQGLVPRSRWSRRWVQTPAPLMWVWGTYTGAHTVCALCGWGVCI